MRERGWPAGVLAAVAVLLALPGCASIPLDGPVTPGRTAAADSDVRFGLLPRGPGPDEDPAAIVRGFLLAAAGVADDFAAARSFLTGAGGRAWAPTTSTVVHRGQPVLRVVGTATPASSPPAADGSPVQAIRVTATVDVVARVDAEGRYTTAPPGATHQADFTLQRVSGQWRISQLGDQVLIEENVFGLVYRGFPLYFLDPAATVLVPDVRWLPERPSTATTLVTELLAGPSPWLRASVVSAFPAGTRLDIDSVPVEGGTARVDLTAEVRSATPKQRALLQAQLQATLDPVLTVSTVEITVAGDPIELPPSPAPVAPATVVEDTPVLVVDDALVRLRAGRLEPVSALADLSGLGLTHPAVSPDQRTYAVLLRHRRELLVLTPGSPLPAPAVSGEDLTSPSVDRLAWAWTSTRASAGVVHAARADGATVEVDAGWLVGRAVTGLRVARDGTRVAVASTGADGTAHVEVAGVVRDGDGTPLALIPDDGSPLAPDLVQVSEVAWVGGDRVAVLARAVGEESLQVHVLAVGGPPAPPVSPVTGATALAAGPGVRSVIVGTSGGDLLVQAGRVWLPLPGADGGRYPAFPG